MHLSRIIGITLLPLMLTYCTNKETKEALASAESLMWVKPDSALKIMESIDTLRINGRASKALYSLLYSMALDRNHVVVTDSRIITQAVKYYERHGSPDDRFKSLCYLGRIQNAANEYDKAVVTFSKALEHADKVKTENLWGLSIQTSLYPILIPIIIQNAMTAMIRQLFVSKNPVMMTSCG